MKQARTRSSGPAVSASASSRGRRRRLALARQRVVGLDHLDPSSARPCAVGRTTTRPASSARRAAPRAPRRSRRLALPAPSTTTRRCRGQQVLDAVDDHGTAVGPSDTAARPPAPGRSPAGRPRRRRARAAAARRAVGDAAPRGCGRMPVPAALIPPAPWATADRVARVDGRSRRAPPRSGSAGCTSRCARRAPGRRS